MNQEVTDALTAAAATWVTLALQQVDQQKQEVALACVHADGADLRVVIRLRRGAIELEGANETAGKRMTLYTEEVAPLRPSTPFATPDSDKKH